MRSRNLFNCLLTVATLALATGCGGGDNKDTAKDNAAKDSAPASGDKVLRFSAIPDQNTQQLKERFDAWAKHLSDKLGVKVEFVPSSDYAASVAAFTKGDIQLAWFGGLTGVQAVHNVEGAKAIVMGEADAKFVSYFIANKSTGLTKSDDFPEAISKLKFTFGSRQSTSGRLMPSNYIEINSGKTADDFFEQEVGYSGKHDLTLQNVRNGTYQAGVLSFAVYEKLASEDAAIRDEAPIIWVTPEYADYNFTAHPQLEAMFGEGFIDKLQKVIVETTDEQLLAAFPRKKLIKTTNEDFAGIKAVAEKLGFLR